MANPMPEDFGGKTLKLNSPAGGVQNPTGISNGPLCITWPNKREKEIYDARSKEFIDTITFGKSHIGTLQGGYYTRELSACERDFPKIPGIQL